MSLEAKSQQSEQDVFGFLADELSNLDQDAIGIEDFGSGADGQKYKLHLEIGDGLVALKNKDPKSIIASLKHKLKESNNKFSIVLKQNGHADPGGQAKYITELKKELEKLRAEREDSHQEEHDTPSLHQQLQQALHKLAESEQHLAELTQTSLSQGEAIMDAQHEMQTLSLQKAQADEHMEALRAEKTELLERIRTLESHRSASSESASRIQQLNAQAERAQAKIAELEQTLRTQREEFEAQAAAFEARAQENDGDAQQALAATLEQVRGELAEARGTCQRLEEEKRVLMSKSEGEIQDLWALWDDEKQQLRVQANEEKQSLQARWDAEKQQLLVAAEQEKQALKAQLAAEADAARQAMQAQWNSEKQALQAQIDDRGRLSDQTIEAMRAQIATLTPLKQQLEEAQNKIKIVKKQRDNLSQTCESQETSITDFKKQIDAMQKDLAAVNEQKHALAERTTVLADFESRYQAIEQEHRALQERYTQAQAELETATGELAAAKTALEESRQTQQTAQASLSGHASQIAELTGQIERLKQKVTEQKETVEQALHAKHQMQQDVEAEQIALEQQREKQRQEAGALKAQLEAMTEENKELRRQVTVLSEHEQQYREMRNRSHTMEIDLDSLRQKFDVTVRNLDETTSALEKSLISQQTLDEALDRAQANFDELQEQHEFLQKQFEEKSQAYDEAQDSVRRLEAEFKLERATRTTQTETLKARMQETLNSYHELKQLIDKLGTDKTVLQEDLEKTAQEVIKLQTKIIEQNMEKVMLEKKLFDLQHTDAELTQTQDALKEQQLRVHMLEQNLAQETDDLERALKDLQRYKLLAEELQEKLNWQESMIQQIPDDDEPDEEAAAEAEEEAVCETETKPAEAARTVEPLPFRDIQELEEMGHDVTTDYLKRKLMEATSRIEHLNLQLHDQRNNLKQAHKTISLLRNQNMDERFGGQEEPAIRSETIIEMSGDSTEENLERVRNSIRQLSAGMKTQK